MSLITCSERCIHQKDGYCSFDETGIISQQLGTALTGCIYYANNVPTKESLPKEFDGFPDI